VGQKKRSRRVLGKIMVANGYILRLIWKEVKNEKKSAEALDKNHAWR